MSPGPLRRILGIDPGSRVTGFGLIESNGMHSRHLASGCIRTGEGELPERLARIFVELRDVLQAHRPHEVAVEQVFVARNAASALILGQARGAAICAAVTLQLPVHEYTPRAIKQAIVGTGGADKEQIQHMVMRILGLTQRPAVDAADALAVALCHAHTASTRDRLQRVVTGGRRP